MDQRHISPSHPRTLATRIQSVFRDNAFVLYAFVSFFKIFQDELCCFVASSELVLRTLLTSSKPPTRREDDKEDMLYNLYKYVYLMFKGCRPSRRPRTHFPSDPAFFEADLHALPGAVAFGVRIPWALVRPGGSVDQFRRPQGWKGRKQ